MKFAIPSNCGVPPASEQQKMQPNVALVGSPLTGSFNRMWLLNINSQRNWIPWTSLKTLVSYPFFLLSSGTRRPSNLHCLHCQNFAALYMPPGRTRSSMALFLSPICCRQAPLQKPANLFISLGNRSFGSISTSDLFEARISRLTVGTRRIESIEFIDAVALCERVGLGSLRES